MAFTEVYNLNPRPYWMQFLYTGQMYSASQQYAINPNQYARIESITPSNKLIHLLQRTVQVISDGPVSVKLYENPTIGTDGTTALNAISNLDRRSSKTPSWNLTSNPLTVSGGTLIASDLVTVNGLANSTGSLVSGITEMVLKPSSKYCVIFNNQGTTISTVVINYLWYETGN